MSDDSMTSGWYYAKAGASAGHEVGPLSWPELYALTQSGVLEPQDIVWNPKLPRGVSAGMIPELFPSTQVRQPSQMQSPPQPLPQQPAAQPAAQPAETQIEPISREQMEQDYREDSMGDLGADDIAEEFTDGPTQQTKRGRTKRSKDLGPDTQSRRLPLLVLLLVVVIAAAGLATYFLYLRDTGDSASERSGATTVSVVSRSQVGLVGNPDLFAVRPVEYTGWVGELS